MLRFRDKLYSSVVDNYRFKFDIGVVIFLFGDLFVGVEEKIVIEFYNVSFVDIGDFLFVL